MAQEIELTNDPIYSAIESMDGLTKAIEIKDKDRNLVCKYIQTIVFTDGLSDDDLSYAQAALHNAQNVFIESMKGHY